MQCQYCLNRGGCKGYTEDFCFRNNFKSFEYDKSYYNEMNNAFALMGKRLEVIQFRGNICISGKVIFIIPYHEIPSWETVKRFYFNGESTAMRESKNLPGIFSYNKYDRIIMETSKGKYYIFPFNLEAFAIREMD